MTAPVASGWSVRRVGLAPTGKRRLLTAHANSGRSPTACRTGLIRTFAALPGRPQYARRAQHLLGSRSDRFDWQVLGSSLSCVMLTRPEGAAWWKSERSRQFW